MDITLEKLAVLIPLGLFVGPLLALLPYSVVPALKGGVNWYRPATRSSMRWAFAIAVAYLAVCSASVAWAFTVYGAPAWGASLVTGGIWAFVLAIVISSAWSMRHLPGPPPGGSQQKERLAWENMRYDSALQALEQSWYGKFNQRILRFFVWWLTAIMALQLLVAIAWVVLKLVQGWRH